MASDPRTGRALRVVGVVIGIGAVAAVVVGVVAGLVTGDVPGALATFGSPVLFASAVVAAFLAYRTGERRR